MLQVARIATSRKKRQGPGRFRHVASSQNSAFYHSKSGSWQPPAGIWCWWLAVDGKWSLVLWWSGDSDFWVVLREFFDFSKMKLSISTFQYTWTLVRIRLLVLIVLRKKTRNFRKILTISLGKKYIKNTHYFQTIYSYHGGRSAFFEILQINSINQINTINPTSALRENSGLQHAGKF